MRSTVDARSRISNRDLIVDKITNITADQIDKTLICQVHIGVLTLKLGLDDARPQHVPCGPCFVTILFQYLLDFITVLVNDNCSSIPFTTVRYKPLLVAGAAVVV